MNRAKFVRQAAAYLCCIAIVISLATVFALNSEPATRSDPDRYYHYAISELTAKEFAPQAIPQIEGLGWNKLFAEKEFLFHALTGIGYRLFQEKGVLLVCMMLGALVILSIYLVNTQVLSPGWALVPTLFVVLASSKFLIRIFSVRPQILGVLFAVLLLGALLKRRHRIACLMSLLFTLSYHAFYIPIALAIIPCIASLIIEKGPRDLFKDASKSFLYVLAGIMIGLLINPYFPSNVMTGIQVLQIALQKIGLPMHHFGVELQSATGSSLLTHLAGFFFLLIVGIWFLGYKSVLLFNQAKKPSVNTEEKEAYFAIFTTFCCFFLFVVITVHNPRGNEYLVPFASLFIARLVQTATYKKTMLISLSSVVLLLQIQDTKLALGSLTASKQFFQPESEPMQAKQALTGVAIHPEKNRIFNCSWDVSPFLFYARPDLVFIDILDPSFLYLRNPEFYLSRYQWVQGEVADSFGLLKETFKADYVFCENPMVASLLKSDPHFNLVFPKTLYERLSSQFTVFSLSNQRRPEFVQHILYSSKLFPPHVESTVEPAALWPDRISEQAPPPIFIDLRAISSPEDVLTEVVGCSLIMPTLEEVERLKGATIVGLGGGPHLQLRVNEKLIYTNVNFSGARRIIHSLVELDEPVTSETKIHLRVCGVNQRDYLGTALSLWTADAMREVCESKYKDNTDLVPQEKSEYSERSEIECLAPFVSNG